MKPTITVQYIINSFEGAFINNYNELILERERNIYINLELRKDDKDLICHLLETKGRYCLDAYADDSEYKALASDFRMYFCDFFDQDWSEDEIGYIYRILGNQNKRNLTEKFIDSEFDLKVLKEEVENESI